MAQTSDLTRYTIKYLKAAIESPENENVFYGLIRQKLNFDIRTLRGLKKIVANEGGMSDYDYEIITDPAFYTKENCIRLYTLGLSELIPYKFYEDQEFIDRTGIDEIPSDFIKNYADIEEFTIRKGIRSIGANAFESCKKLTRIFVEGDTLEDIGEYAFYDCGELKYVASSTALRRLGEACFSNSGIAAYEFHENLLEIPREAFRGCANLQRITGVKFYVGDKAFEYCSFLDTFEATILGTGEKAFMDCSNLKNIKLKADIIGRKSFKGCDLLEEVNFEKIPQEIGEDAFVDCPEISKFNIKGNPYEIRCCVGFKELVQNIRLEFIEGKIQNTSLNFDRSVSKSLEML